MTQSDWLLRIKIKNTVILYLGNFWLHWLQLLHWLHKQFTRTTRKNLLPLPPNLDRGAAAACLRPDPYCVSCSSRNPKVSSLDGVFVVACKKDAKESEFKIDTAIINVLMAAETEKENTESTRLVRKLNRPRLCILPVLGLFTGLCSAVELLIRSRGTQYLAFKQ